jgi:hypothetical protein
MAQRWLVLAAASTMPVRVWAGGTSAAPPALGPERVHSSGAFTYRLPEAWQLRADARPGVVEAWGDPALGVRFVYQPGESGLDALHAACRDERLAAPIDMDPRLRYEYDHVGGVVLNHRALDSAFTVRYDAKIEGHRDWRQRTVTIVGGGHSLCVITYAPSAAWKKSGQARATLDAILGSVVLR